MALATTGAASDGEIARIYYEAATMISRVRDLCHFIASAAATTNTSLAEDFLALALAIEGDTVLLRVLPPTVVAAWAPPFVAVSLDVISGMPELPARIAERYSERDKIDLLYRELQRGLEWLDEKSHSLAEMGVETQVRERLLVRQCLRFHHSVTALMQNVRVQDIISVAEI